MPRTRVQLEQAAAEVKERLDRPDLDPRLRAIGHAFVATVSAENAVRDAVIAARKDGMSWDAITRILGVSRQSAQQQYDQSKPDIESEVISNE